MLNKQKDTHIEIVRWIWLDFWFDEKFIKSKRKELSLSLTENEFGNEYFIENAAILNFNKSFKVINFSDNNASSIISNMEIEIQWLPLKDEKDFWRRLNHFF